eukprot:3187252-Prymnesium_polylepis.1
MTRTSPARPVASTTAPAAPRSSAGATTAAKRATVHARPSALGRREAAEELGRPHACIIEGSARTGSTAALDDRLQRLNRTLLSHSSSM